MKRWKIIWENDYGSDIAHGEVFAEDKTEADKKIRGGEVYIPSPMVRGWEIREVVTMVRPS